MKSHMKSKLSLLIEFQVACSCSRWFHKNCVNAKPLEAPKMFFESDVCKNGSTNFLESIELDELKAVSSCINEEKIAKL